MSDVIASDAPPAKTRATYGSSLRGLFSRRRTYVIAACAVLLLALPFYLERFWLQAGLFAMAAAIGAIGLNLLTGATGQLSMGHAFFLAVGAYGYCVFAGERGQTLNGLGLPPWLAAVLAVLVAGVACSAPSRAASRARTSASRRSR